MKKRVKKKHEHRWWLRNAKERRVTWREFLESFTRMLTPEEIAECIAQGKEDARKELAELKEREHEDRCYECEAYGDDYYEDEDGNLVCACDDCPFDDWEEQENG